MRLAAVALALAVVAASAPPAGAEALRVIHGRLFIAARINGVATSALLDSGAEATLIDPALAQKARIVPGRALTIRGAGGAEGAHLASGVRIDALGQRLARLDVVLLDLDPIGWLVKHPTRAVLGRELFDAAAIEVDMRGQTIRALAPGSKGRGKAYPLTPHAGIEALRVFANGVPADADLDFGNGSSVLISRVLADRLRLARLGKAVGGGIGGKLARDRVILGELTVGGVTFHDVPAEVDPLANAGELNIGTSILQNFVVTVDFGHDRVWLLPQPRGTK